MIHNISYRVFVYGTENEDRVREALKFLFPLSNPHKEIIEGYFKNPVLILHQKIVKKREIKDFIIILNKLDSSTKKRILNELFRKMDDKGNLFLRFGKQQAFLGKLKLVEHGDSIHVKMKIAAYPARRERAEEVVKEIFGGNDVL